VEAIDASKDDATTMSAFPIVVPDGAPPTVQVASARAEDVAKRAAVTQPMAPRLTRFHDAQHLTSTAEVDDDDDDADDNARRTTRTTAANKKGGSGGGVGGGGGDAEDDDDDDTVLFTRRRGAFARDLAYMMYGFGDAKEPDPESIELMEEMLVDYLENVAHRSMDVASRRGRMQTEDLLYVIRNDRKKFARVDELLEMNAKLKEARRNFDLHDPAAVLAAEREQAAREREAAERRGRGGD
jgi:transcription initiation factor TFIID subunit 13